MSTTEEKKVGLGERIDHIRSKYDDKRYAELLAQWDYKQHDVHDETIRKKNKVLVEEVDESGKKRSRYEEREVNRISTSLERISSIHTPRLPWG